MSLQLADAEVGDISDIVNTERYPIHDSGHVGLQALIEHARAELAEDGCCLLKDFLRPEVLEQARAEGQALSGKTFYSVRKVNAYFTEDDENLPQDDPRRTFMERTSGFVTRDMIAPDALIHRLYVSPMMKRFIGACLDEPEIFEYADPFAGLVINVMPEGTEQPWHFDTNEFIVSMMTQKPEAGGRFEYAPMIRSRTQENLGAVGKVVRGEDRSRVQELELNPGDLQIFKGRFSVHRVTRVEGTIERNTAIFAYSEKPGIIGRAQRTKQLYGRLSEAHLQAERNLVRSDQLLD
ncbi:hypothetical protein BK634_15470 [Pseudomonas chlororaphis]|jgi:hypothetical protein|uniref:Phytanoyl-CoA dioxygenase family protein n=1 Tax=Pseudomonas morbosilactucae TaxID=2938197 RepID=A0ABT0JFM2_9PSED|nr:hypothetical protein [Pseudomonas morbosilactucae]MCK9814626.1 phytanoyl-CoA dioxygenase family protein [Pseudomonas morbosilactucae]ROL69155.1 hypothetical protein BK634_15470 [Pseudomonas chlororaphis]WEK11968.1 MAG: hypothetical protein P0Y51_15315 [Pseudomonas sp.]